MRIDRCCAFSRFTIVSVRGVSSSQIDRLPRGRSCRDRALVIVSNSDRRQEQTKSHPNMCTSDACSIMVTVIDGLVNATKMPLGLAEADSSLLALSNRSAAAGFDAADAIVDASFDLLVKKFFRDTGVLHLSGADR
uniref:uncharacterized protein LOC125906835 n=1 Tax=Anopheles coluzzii TaxID=1518534 RepID=UPI0020FFAF0B|nr:uncharacterized protein LOC125906835 [Anopheles coluzzii]